MSLLILLVLMKPAAGPDLTVTASGVAGITPETSLAELNSMFGSDNVTSTREHLGEGCYAEGSVIWSGTGRELAIVWEDGAVSEIRINGSEPVTAEGIGLGSSLADLESVIGEFEMAGFAWDFEGWVDLSGTAYEGLYIRLTPFGPVPDEYLGDRLFRSSELRSLDLEVTDFRIRYE